MLSPWPKSELEEVKPEEKVEHGCQQPNCKKLFMVTAITLTAPGITGTKCTQKESQDNTTIKK